MKKLRYLALAAMLGALALPASAQVIRLGTDVDAGTLDPRIMRNTTAYRSANLIYSGLLQLDADLKPVPDLAESWENPEPTEPLAKLPYEQIFLAVFWRAIDGTGATPGGIM